MHSPCLTVLKKRPYQIRLMANRQRDVTKPLLLQLSYDYFENRLISDGHQWLGQYDSIGTEAGAASTGQDNGAFRHYRDQPCSRRGFGAAETSEWSGSNHRAAKKTV